MKRFYGRYRIAFLLPLMIAALSITGAACEVEKAPATPSSVSTTLSATLVPNADFDAYIYIKQDQPTTVPADMIGASADLVVVSLAMWGTPTEDAFNISGGLTLADTGTASAVYDQLPKQDDIWAALSGETIYFVQGTGPAADSMKSAISNNDFRYYDDAKGLEEAALFPNSGTTKMAAIAIVRPSQTLVSLIAKNSTEDASALMQALLATANLEVVIAGLYSAEEVDIAAITEDTSLKGILERDAGLLAEVKSGLPGIAVSPILDKALTSSGYVKTETDGLTFYKGTLDTGGGYMLPLLLRVEGNRLFAAISTSESYAETLLKSLNL